MTVQQLIEALQKFPPNLQVRITDADVRWTVQVQDVFQPDDEHVEIVTRSVPRG